MSFHFQVFNAQANNPQFVGYYLDKIGMKKSKINPNLWEAFERARDRTQSSEVKINLGEATSEINSSLKVENQMSEFQVQGLVDKQILRGQKIEKGTDKLGRKMAEYEILKSDVEHYIDLMKIWELFAKENLVKAGKHPETGSGIIEYYVPAAQHRFRITEPETKGLVVLELLKKPFVQNLIEELNTTT